MSAGLGAFVGENLALVARWFRRLRREPFSLVFTLVQPAVLLLLFGHLFSEMARAALPGTHYLAFMTAGVVVMTVFNGAMNAGVELLFDRETGFLQRLMVAPVHRVSLVVSRFLYVLLVTCGQCLFIIGMAALLGVGFSTGLAGIGVILAAGVLFGVGLVSLSMMLAFSMKRHGEFFVLIGFLSMPLLLLSTALMPVDLMPGWMAVFAAANPMTWATEAIRSLILEGWNWERLALMGFALAVFDVVMLLATTLVLRRGLS